MNATRLTTLLSLAALGLAACAPSPTNEPQPNPVGTAPVTLAESTSAPLPTAAPAVHYLPPPTQVVALAPFLTATPFGRVPPQATPVDMFFQDYGVNPFTDTAEDHLSTFALDVDTASYAVARRYVTGYEN
jgi:Ca-activated chloride channel homolog